MYSRGLQIKIVMFQRIDNDSWYEIEGFYSLYLNRLEQFDFGTR